MTAIRFAILAGFVALMSAGAAYAASATNSVKSPYVCTIDDGYGRSRPCDAI